MKEFLLSLIFFLLLFGFDGVCKSLKQINATLSVTNIILERR